MKILFSLLILFTVRPGFGQTEITYNMDGNDMAIYYEGTNTDVNTLYVFKDEKSGCIGFKDDKNKVIVEATKYTRWKCYSDGMIMVQNKKEKWGFINFFGEETVPLKYDETLPFTEGKAGVKKGKKFGFIDKTGKTLIDFKYDDVSPFSGGYAAVKLVDKWAYVNTSDQPICKFTYSSADDFKEGFAVVTIPTENIWDPSKTFINTSGKEVVPVKYEFMDGFKGDYCRVKNRSSGWGIIDKKGVEIVACKYLSVDDECHEGFFKVQKFIKEGAKNMDTKGYVDRYGKEITNFLYASTGDFDKNGIAFVCNQSFCTAIDKQGKELISSVYKLISIKMEDNRILGEDTNKVKYVFDLKGQEIKAK